MDPEAAARDSLIRAQKERHDLAIRAVQIAAAWIGTLVTILVALIAVILASGLRSSDATSAWVLAAIAANTILSAGAFSVGRALRRQQQAGQALREAQEKFRKRTGDSPTDLGD